MNKMDANDGNCVGNGDKVKDESDALGNSKFMYQNVVASMPTDRNATHYKMDHKNRGLALIFNHEDFEIGSLRRRAGTNVDCECFIKSLQKLDFDVHVFHNMGHEKLLDQIEAAAKLNHSNNDCILIAVLTHGEFGILYARDAAYKPESLWNPFTADKCPTLAGKPKLFFIQACQGDKLDSGVTLTRTETDGHPSYSHSYKIPTQADFLIAYSTIPGYFSWRNTTRGSWFIQALCTELEDSAFVHDLLTILTFVSRRVAVDYESNTPDTPYMHLQKQIPCITSMLTRLVKFNKKGENDVENEVNAEDVKVKEKKDGFIGKLYGKGKNQSYKVNY